jgi:hypothetical protein
MNCFSKLKHFIGVIHNITFCYPYLNYNPVIYYTSYYSAFIIVVCYYHIKFATRADETQRQNSTLSCFSKVSYNFYVAKEIKQVWSYKYVESLGNTGFTFSRAVLGYQHPE